MAERARCVAALGLVTSIAAGVGSRALDSGVPAIDKSLGDVFFAVMMFFACTLVRPQAAHYARSASAFFICFALELFQLTHLTLRLPRFLRFALGTTFAWHDVACYAVGALATFVVASALERRR